MLLFLLQKRSWDLMWNVNDDGGWRLVVVVVRRRNAIFRMNNWDTNGFPSHVTIKICIPSCWYLLLEPLRGQVGSLQVSLLLTACLSKWNACKSEKNANSNKSATDHHSRPLRNSFYALSYIKMLVFRFTRKKKWDF